MIGFKTMATSLGAAAVLGLCPLAAQADFATSLEGLSKVYQLPVSEFNQAYDTQVIPYTVNNSGSVANGSFTRVAYYLELAGSTDPTRPNGFVYVSFDAAGFTNNATNIGVPANNPFDGTNNGAGGFFSNASVTNMHVISNVPSIVTGTFATGGKVEFWPSNYGGTFQGNDGGFNGGNGHGSMQIHNLNDDGNNTYQTLFGYSDWGGNNVGAGNNPSELGIGTNTGNGFNDWTFSDSGANYTLRNLEVLVNGQIPEPASLGLFALGGLTLLRRRR